MKRHLDLTPTAGTFYTINESGEHAHITTYVVHINQNKLNGGFIIDLRAFLCQKKC